jgi:molecular chaperone DnaK (HSP70)
MSLDLDGILHVTAVEKCTGKSKHITIDRALEKKSDAEIAEARKRLEALYSSRILEDIEPEENAWLEEPQDLNEEAEAGEAQNTMVPTDGVWAEVAGEASEAVGRSRQWLEQMHEEDRDEVIGLNEKIETALTAKDQDTLNQATKQLAELLFFVEGKQ